jgi:hypothetical protein
MSGPIELTGPERVALSIARNELRVIWTDHTRHPGFYAEHLPALELALDKLIAAADNGSYGRKPGQT